MLNLLLSLRKIYIFIGEFHISYNLLFMRSFCVIIW